MWRAASSHRRSPPGPRPDPPSPSPPAPPAARPRRPSATRRRPPSPARSAPPPPAAQRSGPRLTSPTPPPAAPHRRRAPRASPVATGSSSGQIRAGAARIRRPRPRRRPPPQDPAATASSPASPAPPRLVCTKNPRSEVDPVFLLCPEILTSCAPIHHVISLIILLRFACMIYQNVHQVVHFISFHCAMLV